MLTVSVGHGEFFIPADEVVATLVGAGEQTTKRLGVVRKGAVIYLDMFDEISGAVSFNSPLSLPFAIDELVPRLVAAVDADPTTKVAEAR